MSILVTGGTGTIGSAIVKKLVEGSLGNQVIVFSRDEYKQHQLKQIYKGEKIRFIIGDIRSYDALHNAMKGVSLCFHTAAMKHVSICEENPFEAVETNIIGTQNLIRAAKENALMKVLALSTDKAVNPTSVLGATKLTMERLIKRASGNTHFASIRFGNILNSRGSVIPLWQEQAANNQPLTVSDDKATRYFIEIGAAVKACFDAFNLMNGGETFVAECGEPKNIYEMAKEISSVGIDIVGLSQGEKLHEDLFTAAEQEYKTKASDTLWVV